MKQHDSILLAGLVVFCVLTSFMFIYYGVNVTLSGHQPQWLKLFAYVTGGYGLGTVYILSWAWKSKVSWAPGANKLMALCYLAVFVFDTFKGGMKTGLEFVGVLGLALVLWVNWFAIKKVCQRGD